MTSIRQTRPVVQSAGTDLVLPLAHDATAPSTARRAARGFLSQAGLNDDAVYDALLVISEMLTNAVEHALPPVTLRLEPVETDGHPAVRIAVTDGGPSSEPGEWAATGTTDEHGRGCTIVEALTVQNGNRTTDVAAAYWATVGA
ncbi:ATP-binding protein [Kitasatospora indigofera]|uniref:ATP-binding protein n=1 Tax=Kitasatospora indigofera TaxID=67307 RepID=UPI00368076EA